MNTYKANGYTVNELITTLLELNIPLSYKVEVIAEDLEAHRGIINDLDIDLEQKKVTLWYI